MTEQEYELVQALDHVRLARRALYEMGSQDDERDELTRKTCLRELFEVQERLEERVAKVLQVGR